VNAIDVRATFVPTIRCALDGDRKSRAILARQGKTTNACPGAGQFDVREWRARLLWMVAGDAGSSHEAENHWTFLGCDGGGLNGFHRQFSTLDP
jgi:hypothetical protein